MSEAGAVTSPKSVSSTASGAASTSVESATTCTSSTTTSAGAKSATGSAVGLTGPSGISSLNSSKLSSSAGVDTIETAVSFFGGSVTIRAIASRATMWTIMLTAQAGVCLRRLVLKDGPDSSSSSSSPASAAAGLASGTARDVGFDGPPEGLVATVGLAAGFTRLSGSIALDMVISPEVQETRLSVSS